VKLVHALCKRWIKARKANFKNPCIIIQCREMTFTLMTRFAHGIACIPLTKPKINAYSPNIKKIKT
jgi:hypothetical protein